MKYETRQSSVGILDFKHPNVCNQKDEFQEKGSVDSTLQIAALTVQFDGVFNMDLTVKFDGVLNMV